MWMLSPGCRQQFHVTCAQSLGLLCEEAGNYLDNVKYCGYCQHHYSKLVSRAFIRGVTLHLSGCSLFICRGVNSSSDTVLTLHLLWLGDYVGAFRYVKGVDCALVNEAAVESVRHEGDSSLTKLQLRSAVMRLTCLCLLQRYRVVVVAETLLNISPSKSSLSSEFRNKKGLLNS